MKRKKQNKLSKEVKNSSSELIRLNKYISNAGYCSRREADKLIEEGKVKVNGEKVTELGQKVKSSDKVEIEGKLVTKTELVYLLINKPKGYLSTVTDPEGRKTVIDLIGKATKERVYPVGRLDRNTTGVLLLTNDGDLTHSLLHPSKNIHKIYAVDLDKALTKADMQKIADGVELEDGLLEVDEIAFPDPANKSKVGISIHSGRNRVVRRLFEALGYKVEKLDRVMFGMLTKKNIPRGKWRFLSEKEVRILKRL